MKYFYHCATSYKIRCNLGSFCVFNFIIAHVSDDNMKFWYWFSYCS